MTSALHAACSQGKHELLVPLCNAKAEVTRGHIRGF